MSNTRIERQLGIYRGGAGVGHPNILHNAKPRVGCAVGDMRGPNARRDDGLRLCTDRALASQSTSQR